METTAQQRLSRVQHLVTRH